ncbi:MAG TPA: hypothetical protein DD670_03335 [Planctomycetaceae bacterium]|nr:hypothetical protein [Planctomycetaceae bacterium]
MTNDPIVAEVRKTRQQIMDECEGNVGRLIARLKAGDFKNKDRLVSIEQVQKQARTPRVRF